MNLLAGIAPGVTLEVDGPRVLDPEAPARQEVDVNDVGRLVRSEEPTVRRLIRKRILEPGTDEGAGVLYRPRRPPDKPGD